MTEDWPARPAAHLFYAQEKAEIERLLARGVGGPPGARPVPAAPADRPRAARGRRARSILPGPLARLGRRASASSSAARPCRCPCSCPSLPLQFIHEDDVGQALPAVRRRRRPARRLQHHRRRRADRRRRRARVRPRRRCRCPAASSRAPPRARSSPAQLPFLPPAAEWVEAASHPAIMDASKAKRELELAAALHEPRGAARHDRPSMTMATVGAFDVDTAIIGSGFSGLAMAIRLKQEGIEDFTVLERGNDVGGTWHFNTYPGCACDVPSHLYSFSFAPNPSWSETYSRQPEIRDYLRRVADEYGVRAHVRFNCTVDRHRVGRGRRRLDHRDLRWAGARARRRRRPGAACGAEDPARSRASTRSRARRSTPRAGTTTTTSAASASPRSAPARRRSSSCPRSSGRPSRCT